MISDRAYAGRVSRVAEGGPFLVTKRENIRYLSGTDAALFMMIPQDGGPVLGTSRMEADRATAETRVGEVRAYQRDEVPLREGESCAFVGHSEFILGLMGQLGISRARFDSMSEKLHSELSRVELVRSGMIEEMRAIKSAEEIRLIEEARGVAEAVYHEVSSGLNGDVTELEVAGEIIRCTAARGCEPAFEPIVAFGSNTAFPHHHPGKRKLCGSSVILMDLGAKVDGYCSDITRTIAADKGEVERMVGRLRDCVTEVGDGLEAGMKLCQAEAIARASLGEDAGYMTHNLGHGIGLEVHEGPTLSPGSQEVLADGMVFTIEPGIYIAGLHGARWEEDFVCWRGRVRRVE